MKREIIKETNSMRRLMGLELLKEDFEETGVMGVDAPESAKSLKKDEEDHGDVVNEEDVVGVDAPVKRSLVKTIKTVLKHNKSNVTKIVVKQ